VAVGKAPQSLLHDRLMLEAKRNLLYTTLPVSTIAFDLGFNDPAYFSRFFANREGMSPAAYRKLNHTVASSSSGKLLTRPLDSYREAPH
jgi:AraC family transcriptional activator of pobA